MARTCNKCGAAVPWGAPHCVECGSYTHWQRWLDNIGVVLGLATAVVVLGSIAWVWLMEPPRSLRADAEIERFVQRVGESPDGSYVGGAGRCKERVAAALCVQVTDDFMRLAGPERASVGRRLAASWQSMAELNPPVLMLVRPDGTIEATPTADTF